MTLKINNKLSKLFVHLPPTVNNHKPGLLQNTDKDERETWWVDKLIFSF